MALGTDHVTTTIAQYFIPEIWPGEVKIAREANQMVAKNVFKIEKSKMSKGDVFHLPSVSNPTAADKAANTVVAFTAPSESDTTLTVNKHKYVAYMFEDIAVKQSQYDMVKYYTDRAGYALANVVETDLLAQYATLSNTVVNSGGGDLVKADILLAQEELDLVNVPKNDRYWVIYPDQKAAILGITDFTYTANIGSYQKPGPLVTGAKEDGLLFDLLGDPIYYTTNVPVSTTRRNQYLHKDAYALGIQSEPKMDYARIIEHLGDALVVSELYGVSAFRADHGVEVQS